MDMGVAGAEPQSLLDVSLSVLSLAQAKLGVTDLRMRAGQISIQLQRPLAGPDAFGGAAGVHLDHAEQQMGERTLGREGQRCGQSAFGGGESCGLIVWKKIKRGLYVDRREAEQGTVFSGA